MSQQIVITTSLTIDSDNRMGPVAFIVRRVAILTVEVSWRVDFRTAVARELTYRFNPDDALEDIQEGLRTGRLLADDVWSVCDPIVQYDHRANTGLVIEDHAKVLQWFDVNAMTRQDPHQKQLPDAPRQLPETL